MGHLKGDIVDVYSAGTEPKGLDPLAVQVMAEAGVDISGHQSTGASRYSPEDFDYVITVCSDADEKCPALFPAIRHIHQGFDDPPELAKLETDREKALSHYRRVRDEIRSFVEEFTLQPG